MEAEAGSGRMVKFFEKRKHFDERDWKRKRTRKRLILSGAGRESIKNLTASTSVVLVAYGRPTEPVSEWSDGSLLEWAGCFIPFKMITCAQLLLISYSTNPIK